MKRETKSESRPEPVVRYLDETSALACPYGNVRRILTAGEGGVSNVHVVSVMKGDPHVHRAYDEVYYVLSGNGVLQINQQTFDLRPGAVAVIPAGFVHALASDTEAPLEFIIFGIPPLDLDDPRAAPQKG